MVSFPPSPRRCSDPRASEYLDPAAAAAVAAGSGGSWLPEGDDVLVVRADPSQHVSGERAGELEARGVLVRETPGAGHVLRHTDFDEFMAVLDDWI